MCGKLNCLLRMPSQEAKLLRSIKQLSKCLEKVIVKTKLHRDGFVSNIFIREKKEGSVRIILHLAEFNKYIVYRYFKMDTLSPAINLMLQGCWMATIDWKDAYYSVPIAKDCQKYLKFLWKDEVLMYTCYPNSLSSAPSQFHQNH